MGQCFSWSHERGRLRGGGACSAASCYIMHVTMPQCHNTWARALVDVRAWRHACHSTAACTRLQGLASLVEQMVGHAQIVQSDYTGSFTR